MSDWKAEYKWLIDSLGSICDKVIHDEMDWGCAFAVGCQIGEGHARRRQAIRVEYSYNEGGTWVGRSPDDDDYSVGEWVGGEWKQYSLNAEIAAGRTTPEAIIQIFADWGAADNGEALHNNEN